MAEPTKITIVHPEAGESEVHPRSLPVWEARGWKLKPPPRKRTRKADAATEQPEQET